MEVDCPANMYLLREAKQSGRKKFHLYLHRIIRPAISIHILQLQSIQGKIQHIEY